MTDDDDDSGFTFTTNGGVIFTPSNTNGYATVSAPAASTAASTTYTFSSSSGVVGSAGILSASGTPITNQATKEKVLYVVVPKQVGSVPTAPCLELNEISPITPKEMIGICKFLSLVSAVSGRSDVKVEWEKIISDLGIVRHFMPGEMYHSNYDDQTVAYVKLFCA